MVSSLSLFAERLIRGIRSGDLTPRFEDAALELFRLQFDSNPAYRRLCEGAERTPDQVRDWREIPAAPTVAFKELELTAIPPAERTVEFRSSGTTGHRPSRHVHHARSLEVYHASLETWFESVLLRNESSAGVDGRQRMGVSLTPSPIEAPHSSLVHMVSRILGIWGKANAVFLGKTTRTGAWEVGVGRVAEAFDRLAHEGRPVVVFGTAFNFVHLLEAWESSRGAARLALPRGSRVMETGGYKGQSREVSKSELHDWIARAFGISRASILSEYGMCELSSQAYDPHVSSCASTTPPEDVHRCFQFPPWARALVISPETGREVEEGGTGLLRVLDLANVWSVLSVQTEDLARRRGSGFELLGRSRTAEPRGCSLMAASAED